VRGRKPRKDRRYFAACVETGKLDSPLGLANAVRFVLLQRADQQSLFVKVRTTAGLLLVPIAPDARYVLHAPVDVQDTPPVFSSDTLSAMIWSIVC
jgi:hypothetical protein